MKTKLRVWRQGPLYPELGKKVIELPYSVRPGPSDSLVKIQGFNVFPDKDGNFLAGDYTEEEQDAVHTFGIVNMTIDLFEKLSEKPVVWSWRKKENRDPLKVFIRNNDIHTRFLRENQCIELDYYGKSDELIYTCRTTDLVAHETAHAIFDGVFPNRPSRNTEAKGTEEAFCDLLSMFLTLSQPDLCEEVMRETGGDLGRPSILSLFGAGHGHRNNPLRAVRSAQNHSRYDPYALSPYAFCEVLVGVLYELLTEMFKADYEGDRGAQKLFEIGAVWQKMILETFLKLRPDQMSMGEFARVIILDFPKYKLWLTKLFRQRGVVW